MVSRCLTNRTLFDTEKFVIDMLSTSMESLHLVSTARSAKKEKEKREAIRLIKRNGNLPIGGTTTLSIQKSGKWSIGLTETSNPPLPRKVVMWTQQV